jgi:peptidoglycan/LPS O-acetylase OafA/YrhL
MGLIRLYLALVVAADHLFTIVLQPLGMNNACFGLPTILCWKFGMIGPKAVFCFYILSGFLIAFVLDRRYGFNAKNIKQFYAARLSRIYSLYWPLFIVMVATDFTGSQSGRSLWDFLTGFFLFGSDWIVAFGTYPVADLLPFPNPLAPAWTLGAEMTFYVVAPVLLCRTRVLLIVFAASFGLHLGLLLFADFNGIWQYVFLPSTLWLFLLGSLSWYAGQKIRYPRTLAAISLPLAILFTIQSNFDPWDNPWFLAAAFCVAGALPGIFAMTRNIRWMNMLGNLSYPVYLLHMSVLYILFLQPQPWALSIGKAIIAIGTTESNPNIGGSLVFLVFAAICLVAAALLHRLIERPTRRLLRLLFSGLIGLRTSVIAEPR